MVACEWNKSLGRYHDGELPAAQRALFEQHLAACGDCVGELEQMRTIARTLRAGVMPRASAELITQLESLASHVEDATVMRFVRRLTAVAAAILLAATLQWTLHAPATVQPVASAPTSPDEKMIIDPETAANNVAPDNALALADTQLDPLASELSGGKP